MNIENYLPGSSADLSIVNYAPGQLRRFAAVGSELTTSNPLRILMLMIMVIGDGKTSTMMIKMVTEMGCKLAILKWLMMK